MFRERSLEWINILIRLQWCCQLHSNSVHEFSYFESSGRPIFFISRICTYLDIPSLICVWHALHNVVKQMNYFYSYSYLNNVNAIAKVDSRSAIKINRCQLLFDYADRRIVPQNKSIFSNRFKNFYTCSTLHVLILLKI